MNIPNNLGNKTPAQDSIQVTRIGVYGVLMDGEKMLLVRQQRGPYAGKLDFPGGGIEFGESPEQALRREFAEEVAMGFDSLKLIVNLTTVVTVPSAGSNPSNVMFHIGMIYKVNGSRLLEKQHTEFQPVWIDPKNLSEEHCSNLLWKYVQSP